MFGGVSTLSLLRRNPSAGLLAVQLVGLLLYPLMESSPRGRTLFGLFGLLVLGIAVWVVRRSPWITWLGVTLALPVVTLSALRLLGIEPAAGLVTATAALEAVFYFYAAGSLIAYMLQDQIVATDELFAAGATFTLLAWAFAYLFVVCQAMQPGAFGYSNGTSAIGTTLSSGGADGISMVRSWTELLYCSVAVLSSVGLSDILPVTPMARALVMLESFTGIMYIALVVSRLISLMALARKDRSPR
jgi:hypothetical protein